MKILLGHVIHSPGLENWYKDVANVAGDDIEVNCFCVTLNPPNLRLNWKELDSRWRQKERTLMEMYARLLDAASGCDVFFLYNGANIHPEFLQYLPTFNVYCCFDDPESSSDLSAPVATSFHAVFYGNIASRFQYESWGCKNLSWLPIFTAPGDVPEQHEGEKVLSADRDVDVCLIGEKNIYRNKRLEMLTSSFPQAKCFGKGWQQGSIDDATMQDLYRRSKIGWNVHNSTGPINRRMFTLPAFGVLQISDNKTGLGQIFELGKEVVGFDTIPEAIDLTRYYLANEAEGREIALNGWRRFWQDYHATAIWQRIKDQICVWQDDLPAPLNTKFRPLPEKTLKDNFRPVIDATSGLVETAFKLSRKVVCEIKANRPVRRIQIDERAYIDEVVLPYIENPEMRGVNMAKERLANGEPFEWPNILALNWAVTALIGDAKNIVDIGSGTGPFAQFASVDKKRTIHCFESDDFARRWAEENRSRPNVSFFKSYDDNLSINYDLLVSVDVIEHVFDLKEFLKFCSSLAPRAIFTSPNRDVIRGPMNLGPPDYPPHVREFDAGELFWILKQYYKEVYLYHMPDVYVPWLAPMDFHTMGTPIIAKCQGPFYFWGD